MEKRGLFKRPKQVLIFNGCYTLIAIIRSLNSVTDLTCFNTQSVSFACTGKYVSTNGFYFRHLHPDIEVVNSDVGELVLQDYDKLCFDTTRRYHSNKEMVRRKIIADSRRKRKI